MNTYQELINYLQEFNNNNKIELSIDTIRITFSKQHKLNDLKALGKWHRLDKTSEQIKRKLNKRLDKDEITTVYQFERENIYFYNSNIDKPKYRYAVLVIFGIKQYHKKPPPKELINKMIDLLVFGNSSNDTSLDICYDMKLKPSIENLKAFFELENYIHQFKYKTDTFYINETYNSNISKVCIYNKQQKNSLGFKLYRIEATIQDIKLKALELPLNDFKNIIELARG